MSRKFYRWKTKDCVLSFGESCRTLLRPINTKIDINCALYLQPKTMEIPALYYTEFWKRLMDRKFHHWKTAGCMVNFAESFSICCHTFWLQCMLTALRFRRMAVRSEYVYFFPLAVCQVGHITRFCLRHEFMFSDSHKENWVISNIEPRAVNSESLYTLGRCIKLSYILSHYSVMRPLSEHKF
jgi:hypothetical protein